MDIFVSHWSALQLHTLARQGVIAPLRLSHLATLTSSHARISTCNKEPFERLFGENFKVDVMVDAPALVHTNKQARVHLVTQPLPPGCIYEADGFYVASPELALAQVAPSLKQTDLIVLLMECAGSYTTLSRERAYGLKPLVDLDRLKIMAGKLHHLRGAQTLQQALAYALARSASPMETALALALSLPQVSGGYGLQSPQLNATVALDGHAARIAGQAICVCDLLWSEARIALEYDSREFHDGIYQHGHDTMRALALESMGFHVQPVTYMQVANTIQLDEIAQRVARRTGKRLRANAPSVLLRRERLIERLIHARPFGHRLPPDSGRIYT